MSRFLGCGCNQRPPSELQPIVWAGFHNEWRRIPEMTDEFNSGSLSSRKWFPCSPFSFGTKPGIFVPSNVSMKNQALHLTAKCDGAPCDAPQGYKTWTTSAIVSRHATLYGYFECCFRASNTALKSSFQLIGKDGDKMREVKVFSYSAADDHKKLVYMDASYAYSGAQGERQAVRYPLKKMIFDMPENPVTVGLDCSPDYLKTYVDGQVIRHLENKHWDSPMHISFALETCADNFGLPQQRPLRVGDDFEIYYIRSWDRHPNERRLSCPGVEEESLMQKPT